MFKELVPILRNRAVLMTATVGIPNGRNLPSPLGISTSRTGGGK